MQESALARIVEEAVVDRLRAQHRGQWHEAAGQSLRQAQQVRLHARLLAGEHRAGAAEADRDLVGDQEHAVRVAEFACASQVLGIVHAHAAGALHARLQDQRADLAGIAFEQVGQCIGRTVGAVGGGLTGLAQVGIR